jgi:hypothetical protein
MNNPETKYIDTPNESASGGEMSNPVPLLRIEFTEGNLSLIIKIK